MNAPSTTNHSSPLRVLVFGASGLVGGGVLAEALDNPQVGEVVSIGRRPVPVDHPKLRQVVHDDFGDLEAVAAEFEGIDAVLWCLGISSMGVDEDTYTRITHDYTLEAAQWLRRQSPEAVFCFVSGQGADETERSRAMWARIKGRTENMLEEQGLGRVHHFRPGFIRPVRGTRKPSLLQRLTYPLFLVLYGLTRAIGGATTNVEVGRAMLASILRPETPSRLNSRAINATAGAL